MDGLLAKGKSIPLKITLFYVILGGLWILFSDRLLISLVNSPQTLGLLEILKGWFFILVTASLLYFLIRRGIREIIWSQENLKGNLIALETSHHELATTKEMLNQQLLEIQATNYRFRRIYQGIKSGLLLQNSDGKVIQVNKAACQILNLTHRQLLGKASLDPSWSVTNEDGLPLNWEMPLAPFAPISNSPDQEQTIIINTATSGRRWISALTYLILEPQSYLIEEIVTTLVDITESKLIEYHESILSEINRQVLSEEPLIDILNFLCEQLVAKFTYQCVWIALKEPDGSVTTYASKGIASSDLANQKVRWDDSAQGHGAIGRAIQTGQPQIHNLQNNPDFELWHSFISKYNLQTVTALPLTNQGDTLGALAVYSSTLDFFTPALVAKLEHFAVQVALSLSSAKNRESLQRYKLLSENTQDIFMFLSTDGHILDVNQAAVQSYGYSRQELLSLHACDLRLPELAPELANSYHCQVEQSLVEESLYKTIHQRKNGSTFPVEVSSQSAMLDNTKVLLCIVRDISENILAQAALRENEERYHYMFENMMNAVAVYKVIGDAEDFILTNFNKAAKTLDNLSRQNSIGQSIHSFPLADKCGYLDALKKVWHSGQPLHFPATFMKDQRVFSYRENYISKLPTDELMLIYEDVTARKQAEEAVWQEKERAQVTLHSIGDAVITTDVYGSIEYLNPVAEDLTGWSNYAAKGMPSQKVFQILDEYSASFADNSVHKCLLYGNIVTPTNYNILIHREGYRYIVEHSAAPIRNRQGVIIGAVLAFHDVTDKKALQQQLSHQAQHDSLTGLPNRLLLTDRLNQALVRARRKGHLVGILFLDLDRFRPINDTLGHTVGDALLQATSRRLSSTLREGDTIARQGGDEFAILIPEMSQAEDAAIVAQKTLEIFSEPFIIEGEEIFITTSIGISLYPSDGIDGETLVKHADTALSHAKIQGRNNYQFFTTALNASAYERLSMENSLRKAIEREELTVYYQPQVNLTNGKIVGVEALVRWNHPQKSLISPQQFIPIAEETGLILPLGEWVLKTACVQVKTWQEEGRPPIRLAVNLSARQFSQPNLVSTVAHILDKTGLDPHFLDLEITESIAIQDVDFTIQILNAFKVMGITLTIDDFGTGFSSLYYLKRFPIDTLKIDRSFVADIDSTPDGGQIVNAIIVLAQNLHLKVIAEGVETTEQFTFLKEKKCDEMQGFLFSKPVIAQEFEEML